MADITMCVNTDCPKFKECYRAQAEPGFWQSVARFDSDGCQHFVPVWDKETAQKECRKVKQ